jgi:hypothetical protein
MPYSMVLSPSHPQHPQSIKCKMSPETALPESHTSAKDDHDRVTLERYLTLTHPQEAVGLPSTKEDTDAPRDADNFEFMCLILWPVSESSQEYGMQALYMQFQVVCQGKHDVLAIE